jgi:transposase
MSAVLPLPAELWQRLPAAAQALIRAQQEQIQLLQQRLAELEARLGQNSTNSSKPPSSDPPAVKRRPPRPTGQRQPGKQLGQPKQSRPLVPPDQVQQLIPCYPTACRRCGHTLHGEDPQPLRHQVAELPPVPPTVLEYRLHRRTCPVCRTQTCATLPDGVPPGAFGPRLQALSSVLSGGYRLSKRAVADLLGDLFGLSVSTGMIVKLQAQTAAVLAEPVQQAQQYVRERPAHVDETSWKHGRRKAWLWVAVTSLVTVFHLARRRDAVALRHLVGEHVAHVLTSDRFQTYETIALEQRQICWAHLRRDFQALIDRGGAGAAVGRELLLLSDDLFFFWHRVRDGTWTREQFGRWLRRWRPEWEQAVRAGTACLCGGAQTLCGEWQRLDAALWRFAEQPGVEPTNNAAERALRAAVCWRKTSYGTQSESGRQFVERMLTVVASCRQQGRNVLDYVTRCCQASRQHRPLPSLLPHS